MLPIQNATMPPKPSVDDVLDKLYNFGLVDYGVFVTMLLICSLIGLYFGFQDRNKYKNSKTKGDTKAGDYFLGGRDLHIAPVAMSLIASYISGITLLGTVTEIYLYGIQYCYVLISFILLGIVMHYIIIPVFHNLKLTSTFGYLESRYNGQMRLLGSFVFAFGEIFYASIVVYVSAIAYQQLTGVDVHKIIPIIMTICIFYTSMGGMKAVVWTDLVQITVTFGVLIFVAYRGTISVGGFSVVMQKNLESGRIEAPK
jgi:Na+/proline symporter